MSRARLMSVRTELVKDVIVREIADRAQARSSDDISTAALAALGDGDLGDMAGLASLGYHARAAEAELFERARADMPGLTERLEAAGVEADWSAAAADVSRELAAGEPAGRPDPDDPDAVSWQVPGPGGHVRHYVALLLRERAAPQGDPERAKLAFTYGFLVRCCEEVAPDAGRE